MMDGIMTIISAVVVLGVLIFVHELGHFLMAKKAGVGVTAFSLGFGPRLWGFKRGETDYRISAVPLGGYVRMVGEQPGEDIPPEDIPRSFSHKPVGWRMAIVAAGPMSNLVLAVVTYYLLVVLWGVPALTTRVGDVSPQSPAAAAGLQKDDLVLAINGKPLKYWGDMVAAIQENEDRTLHMIVQRDRREVSLRLKPFAGTITDLFGEPRRVFRVGILASQEVVTQEIGPLEAFGWSFKNTYLAGEIIVLSVIKLVQRKVSLDNLGGPILIAQAAGQAARRGLYTLLDFAALISVNLAILNFLPIPILDGGHLLFFLLEAVRRKPISIAFRERAQQVGMAILILLMVVVFYNDITRLVTGGVQ